MRAAAAEAELDGSLGISIEAAGKRQFSVWDVNLCKQFAGLLIGLIVSAITGEKLYEMKMVVLELIGARRYKAGLAVYLAGRGRVSG